MCACDRQSPIVKLVTPDALKESFPLGAGERQDGAVWVLGVAQDDVAVWQQHHLDALAVLAASGLEPGCTCAQRWYRVSPPNQRQMAASFSVPASGL